MKWFCLSNDGQLYLVGQFETFDEADDAATEQGHNVIWLINEQTAEQWRKTLTQEVTHG